jgi:hypothetical protein
MNKYILIGVFALALGSVSCEPEQSKEELEELAIDKDKNCPPSDRNCNGIPDNQEN